VEAGFHLEAWASNEKFYFSYLNGTRSGSNFEEDDKYFFVTPGLSPELDKYVEQSKKPKFDPIFQQGPKLILTSALQDNALALQQLWGHADIKIALDTLNAARDCHQFPQYNYVELAPWIDMQLLGELFSYAQKTNVKSNDVKEKIKSVADTAWLPKFPAPPTLVRLPKNAERMVHGSLALRPYISPLVENDSIHPKWVRGALLSLIDTAFDKNNKMTAETCAQLDRAATWLNLTGVHIPRNPVLREKYGIDFPLTRDFSRVVIAAMTAGIKKSNLKKLNVVPELGVQCFNAYQALRHLSSDLTELSQFSMMLKYGDSLGNYNGTRISLKDNYCTDWKYAFNVNEPSDKSISKPKDTKFSKDDFPNEQPPDDGPILPVYRAKLKERQEFQTAECGLKSLDM